MSENNGDGKIRLILSFDPTSGQVSVSGPINDRLFCLGILELAKECLAEHAKQQQSQILVARPQIAGIS